MVLGPPSRRTKVAAAGFTALALLGLPAAPPASTAPVVISDTDLQSGGRSWQMYGSLGGPVYVDDAGMNPGAGRNAEDAFDGALFFYVDDLEFTDADGDGDLSGTTLSTGPTTTGALVVSRADRAAGAYLRTVIKMRNPAAAPYTGTVTIFNNYGSDSETKVHRTSSGDQQVTRGDRWFITAEGNEFGDGDDPVITTVLWGAQAAERPAALPDKPISNSGGGNGNGYLDADFDIRIPASSTRYLVFFTELHATPSLAREAAAKYNKRPTRQMLKGLTRAQLRTTLNWNL